MLSVIGVEMLTMHTQWALKELVKQFHCIFKRPTSIAKGDSQTDQFQLIKHMYTHTLVSRCQNAYTSDLATRDHTYVCTHSSTDSDTTHTVQA